MTFCGAYWRLCDPTYQGWGQVAVGHQGKSFLEALKVQSLFQTINPGFSPNIYLPCLQSQMYEYEDQLCQRGCLWVLLLIFRRGGGRLYSSDLLLCNIIPKCSGLKHQPILLYHTVFWVRNLGGSQPAHSSGFHGVDEDHFQQCSAGGWVGLEGSRWLHSSVWHHDKDCWKTGLGWDGNLGRLYLASLPSTAVSLVGHIAQQLGSPREKVPRNKKQKLPGCQDLVLETVTESLLPYALNQSNIRFSLD